MMHKFVIMTTGLNLNDLRLQCVRLEQFYVSENHRDKIDNEISSGAGQLASFPGYTIVSNGKFLINYKIHVQTNTKSVQCLCINTKHNKVRITQSQ